MGFTISSPKTVSNACITTSLTSIPRPRIFDYMLSLLGGNVHRGRRNNKILYRGRYVKYPFENGLYDLEPQDRFECLYHYIFNKHPAPANFRLHALAARRQRPSRPPQQQDSLSWQICEIPLRKWALRSRAPRPFRMPVSLHL